MMNAVPRVSDSPRAVLQHLIDQHGRFAVLALALMALLRPQRPPAVLSDRDLSNHLRRDIGLRGVDPPQKGWEHYR